MTKSLTKLRTHIADPAWDDKRARAVLARIGAARPTRPRRSLALFGTLAVAVAAAVIFVFVRPNPANLPTEWAQLETELPPLFLRDGSRVDPLEPTSRVVVTNDEVLFAGLRLERGAFRFHVVPNKARRFRVTVGAFAVEALGTVFTVMEQGERRIAVSVEQGRVAVRWPSGHDEVGAGEARTYVLADDLAEPAKPLALPNAQHENDPVGEQPLQPPASEEPLRPHGARSAVPDWRPLARQRSVERAFDAMQKAGHQAVRDLPQELMLASDVARRTGHLDVAIRHLSRVVAAHATDPRASVAAFTLGRVHLQAKRAVAAAQAFEQAYALEPAGALAEDALAKAVAAWKLAADVSHARAAARTYLSRFPEGRHATTMKDVLTSP